MAALSIDTAANLCAVAVNDDNSGELLSVVSHDIGRGHAEILMDVIDEAMNQASMGYKDLERVIATIGPGSFTGVRVGISVGRAIGLGLSIPVVGVSILQASAQYAVQVGNGQNAQKKISVIIDANRDEFYFQPFQNGIPVQDAKICKFNYLLNNHDTQNLENIVICGSGAKKFSEEAVVSNDEANFTIAHQLATAPIESVATIGLAEAIPKMRPEPLYLRGADAKQQQGFAVLRADSQNTKTVS